MLATKIPSNKSGLIRSNNMRRWLVTLGALVFLAAIGLARAGEEDISFPVAELGNCASKEACFVYCDAPENVPACFDFAVRNGLISEEERQIAETVITEGGPGGCRTETACRAYCDDPAYGEECLEFAVAHGLIPPEEAEIARTVLTEGGPGGCRAKEECETYCEDPAHGEECLAFARTHGLLEEDEARIAEIIIKEGGPGGCFSESSCRAYCENPEHLEECVEFAVAHDFMTEEEARQALATGGTGPGGCRGDACETYCEDPAHLEACIAFAEERGFISSEEAARVRKIGVMGGPGGCRSEAECRAYCETPEHADECLQFAVDNGFMTAEEAERAQKFMTEEGPGGCRGEECRLYCENPDHAEECIEFAIDNGFIPPEEAERARRGLEFLKNGGPGGCRTPEACEAFCRDPENTEICFNFAVERGFISPEELERMKADTERIEALLEAGGPGGCSSQEECREYCMIPLHSEECQVFGQLYNMGPKPEGYESGKISGPGGCSTPEECIQFCADPEHRFACGGLRVASPDYPPGAELPPGVAPPPDFEGPGGCRTPAECYAYCSRPEYQAECGAYRPSPPEPPSCPVVSAGCGEGYRPIEYRGPDGCPVLECRPYEDMMREPFTVCPVMPVPDSCPEGFTRSSLTTPEGCAVTYCRPPEDRYGEFPDSDTYQYYNEKGEAPYDVEPERDEELNDLESEVEAPDETEVRGEQSFYGERSCRQALRCFAVCLEAHDFEQCSSLLKQFLLVRL